MMPSYCSTRLVIITVCLRDRDCNASLQSTASAKDRKEKEQTRRKVGDEEVLLLAHLSKTQGRGCSARKKEGSARGLKKYYIRKKISWDFNLAERAI